MEFLEIYLKGTLHKKDYLKTSKLEFQGTLDQKLGFLTIFLKVLK